MADLDDHAEEAPSAEGLAPPPDFRYVALAPATGVRPGSWAMAATGLGASGLSFFVPTGGKVAIALSAMAFAGALLLRPRLRAASLAIVPWGVLVEPDSDPRVLHWGAVRDVRVEAVHGFDQATPTTLYTQVTVATAREQFVGRTKGDAALDRLVVHCAAYAREAAHEISADLRGERAIAGVGDPTVEPLLAWMRGYLGSHQAVAELALEGGSYRGAAGRTAGVQTAEALGRILRSRADFPCDPRPLAALLTAELGVASLTTHLVGLATSPHPLLAAIARKAAQKLGVEAARVGPLEEVAAFLRPADFDALARW